MSEVILPNKSKGEADDNDFSDVYENDVAIKEVVEALDDDNIAAGAGIAGSKLANDILKLAVAGTERKVAFGESIVLNTNEQTANLEIAHGLGKTPAIVVATAKARDINVGVFGFGAAKFIAEIRDITGANISENTSVYWIAIA